MGSLGEVRILLMDRGIAVGCNHALRGLETSLPGGFTVQAGGFHTRGVPGLYLITVISLYSVCSRNSFSSRQRQFWQCGPMRNFAAVV